MNTTITTMIRNMITGIIASTATGKPELSAGTGGGGEEGIMVSVFREIIVVI